MVVIASPICSTSFKTSMTASDTTGAHFLDNAHKFPNALFIYRIPSVTIDFEA